MDTSKQAEQEQQGHTSKKMRRHRSTSFLVSELLFIFVAVPLFTKYFLSGIYNLIPLVGISILLLVLLYRSKRFDNRLFVRVMPINWSMLIGRFMAVSLLVFCFVYFFNHELLYYLPQENPDRYLLTIILYPFWSVIPQEIIYRAWYFQRYSNLFASERTAIFVNSVLFGLAHTVFGNGVAIVGAFLVCFIFSHTYNKYNSLLIVVIEHSFYGVMIFTLGMGKYFM